MEKVCVDTVEQGYMTKDLALLVGPDQKWLTTEGFLDKVDENLQRGNGLKRACLLRREFVAACSRTLGTPCARSMLTLQDPARRYGT